MLRPARRLKKRNGQLFVKVDSDKIRRFRIWMISLYHSAGTLIF